MHRLIFSINLLNINNNLDAHLYAEYLNDNYLIFITADTTILFFNKDIMELTNISSFMDANLKL